MFLHFSIVRKCRPTCHRFIELCLIDVFLSNTEWTDTALAVLTAQLSMLLLLRYCDYVRSVCLCVRASMGGATGGWEGVQGGTAKMIFLVINLCFCKIFSLIDRQRILNIRNFFDPRNASVAGL